MKATRTVQYLLQESCKFSSLFFSNHNTNNVDLKQFPLFCFKNASVELLLLLFAQGIYLLQKGRYGFTIAHNVESCLSADKYHQVVKWLVKHNFSSSYKLNDIYNATAVQYALETP